MGFKAITIITLGIAIHHTSYAHCFSEAGRKYGIDGLLLKAIAVTESSLRHDIESPTNDIGLMGINRSWLPILNRRFGITEKQVWQPCTNVHIGAWILAGNYRQFGKNWNAVGAYAASCRKLKGKHCHQARMAYANRVYRNWLKLKQSS